MLSNQNITWESIVAEYTAHPRDVITAPIVEKPGIWFFVHTENGDVYITDAENHADSTRVRRPIKLKKEQFEDMLQLYLRREAGEQVSREAKDKSYHQVYWYGIFRDLKL